MARDLNDILVFTQVADAGSFTAAAKALDLPKSTVSRRVARLEESLGVRLLHRTTRRLNLTDAGRTLQESGTRIMSELADAQAAVTDMHAQPRGRLRITAPVELPVMPRLVTDFLDLYPDVHIELDLTNRYVDLVEEGVDVAIRAGRLADSSLIARKLADTCGTLVASPAYIDSRGAPQSIEDLADHDCVIFGPGSANGAWRLNGPHGPVKVAIKGRISVNHLALVKHAAIAGFGIALLPTIMVADEIAAGHLRIVLPQSSPPPSSLWAVTPSRKHVSPVVRAFLDFLTAQLSPETIRPD